MDPLTVLVLVVVATAVLFGFRAINTYIASYAPKVVGAFYFPILIVALFFLVLLTTGASSQTFRNANDTASESNVGIIFEGSSQQERTAVGMAPDVSVGGGFPSPQTCRYTEGYGGSTLFGLIPLGLGMTQGILDEGCEARADSAHMATLGEIVAAYGGNPLPLLSGAIVRMGLDQEEWDEVRRGYMVKVEDVTWEEVWIP